MILVTVVMFDNDVPQFETARYIFYTTVFSTLWGARRWERKMKRLNWPCAEYTGSDQNQYPAFDKLQVSLRGRDRKKFKI